MKFLAYLPAFLLLGLLMHMVQSKDVIVPWNSELLKKNNVFIVSLGDKLVFEPCGDSNLTSLVYTNSRDAFANCIAPSGAPTSDAPTSDACSDFRFSEIGNCVNPSGRLLLPVNTGIAGIGFVAFEIYGVYYFLSDHDPECENGLKVVIVVSGNEPPTDQSPPASLVCESSPSPEGSGGNISLLDAILTACALVFVGTSSVLGFVLTVICCRRRKTTKAVNEEEQAVSEKADRAKERVVPLQAETKSEREVPSKEEREKERVVSFKPKTSRERAVTLKEVRAKERALPFEEERAKERAKGAKERKAEKATQRGVPLKSIKPVVQEAPIRVMTPFGEQIKWSHRSSVGHRQV